MKANQKRTARRAADVILIEPMSGPGRPALCVMCGRLFAEGETWQRMTRDGWAVGVHGACLGYNGRHDGQTTT